MYLLVPLAKRNKKYSVHKCVPDLSCFYLALPGAPGVTAAGVSQMGEVSRIAPGVRCAAQLISMSSESTHGEITGTREIWLLQDG